MANDVIKAAGTEQRTSCLERLSGDVVPCSVWRSCLHSEAYRSKPLAACRDCRLAQFGGGAAVRWRASEKSIRHPVLEQEKRDARRQRVLDKQQKRRSKDHKRQEISRVAERAERQTERRIGASGGDIRPTRNSGRVKRDGDHQLVAARGLVQLDTKLQTGSENPVVKLTELDKIRRDALNGGAITGGLVIRNKYGRAVVVFAEEDLHKLLTNGNALTDNSNEQSNR